MRGNLPVPQEGYIRYGGNTSYYSLHFSLKRHLVFNANLLMHDCTYFDNEYATKLHWVYSSLIEVV